MLKTLKRLRIGRLLDTIPEVLTIYAGAYALCVFGIAWAEDWRAVDALWFGLVTVTTTGYGDLTPDSTAGRTFAVVLMIVSWVLNIILAAQVAAKLIVDSDAWTHDEQEEMKQILREVRAKLDERSAS